MQPLPLRRRLNRLLWELGEQELESVDDRLPAAAKRVAALLELTFASIRQVVDEAELLLGIPDSGARTPPATREPLRAQPELTETTPSGSHSPPAPTPDPTPYPECSTSSGPHHFRVLPATSRASHEAGPEPSDVPTSERGEASRRRWGRHREEPAASRSEQGASHNARGDGQL